MVWTKFILILSLFTIGVFAEEAPSVSPEKAIQSLKDGNLHFVKGTMEHPNLGKERRDETMSNGQHPFAALVSCSDSRVPVELIFDKGIGDLFIIRVAGNVIGEDETGSLEYAAEHLKVPLIVVLGHSECGAVTATVKGAAVEGSIKKLVEKISPAVESAKKSGPDLQGVYMIRAAIKENVKLGILNLKEKSPLIKELVEKDKIKIVGAIYNIYTGEVEWLDEK